ncbi:hypothetical protein [Winogradskyella endarachnes]|uniref:Uncharacterized protein n=1 Tax=Winogradskyella endarachnes TaxID=2681965 RepID=A0A6L6UGI1_9FLAO|nr:hypothetical protein [Winogradskyella endarachnes]MUU79907.1 hypothetical protein [Winogradskyella endarachnes]
MKNFYDLSKDAQDYINSRFSQYDINGEEAFDSLFSDEMKELSSDQIVELMRQKDISHIISQSNSPELTSNLDNVFLEDYSINRARGSESVTQSEFELAWEDQISDVEFINSNESTLDALEGELENIDNTFPIEEIVGGSFILGSVFTGVETYRAIERNEIKLNDAPSFFAIKTGGKTIRFAVIGMSLASSSPVIVSAGVGYLIYKNKMLISKFFNGMYNFITHEKTKEYTELAINGTVVGISTAGNYTYKAITSETSKNLLLATGNAAINSTKYLANKSYEIATHQTTKKIVSETLNITGKTIVSTVKFSGKIIGKMFNRKK